MKTNKKVSNNFEVITVKRLDDFLHTVTRMQEKGYLLEDFLIIDVDNGERANMIANAKLYFKKATINQSMSRAVKDRFKELEDKIGSNSLDAINETLQSIHHILKNLTHTL